MPGYIKNCCITELFDKPGLVQIDGCCPICQDHWRLCVTQKNLERWIAGEKIQDVFLVMNVKDRELLISGLCNVCFDKATEPDSFSGDG